MCSLCVDLNPEQIAWLNEQEETMGGKPSKGTRKDRRLKANKPRRNRRMPTWLRKRIRG